MGFLSEHKPDIINIVIVLLGSYVLYLMVFVVAYKGYIVSNWSDNKIRCNPAFMPLAGMLNIPDPDAEDSGGFLTVSKKYFLLIISISKSQVKHTSSGKYLVPYIRAIHAKSPV